MDKLMLRLWLALLVFAGYEGEGALALITNSCRSPHQRQQRQHRQRQHCRKNSEACCSSTTRLSLAPFGLDDTTDLRHETIRSALSRLDQLDVTASKFFTQLEKSIEVKPSLIEGAGRGLFAKKKIRAGSIISFCPISGIGVDFGETSTFIATNEENQDYFDNTTPAERDGDYLLYLVGSRPLMGHALNELFEGDPIFIDVNPNQEDKIGWSAHYINDGAIVTSVGEAGILDYYQKTRSAKNCVLVPFGPCPLVAAVSTRKIRKGEELLTTYGGSFWADALMPDEELEVTEAIQQQAMETAKDIFLRAKSIAQTYQIEARMLQSVFSP